MNIVCLGDSITKGRVWLEGLRPKITRDNYPSLLARLLPGAEVVNAGLTNDTSAGMLARFETDVAPRHPDVVVLECGGNDCNFRWDEVAANPGAPHLPVVPEAQFVANLRALIGRVRALGAVPVLATIPPLDSVRFYAFLDRGYGSAIAQFICRAGGLYEWQEMYSRRIEAVGKAEGVAVAPVRQAFLATPDFRAYMSEDGIHPNEEGYRLVTRAVWQVLPDVLLG
jgi:lysophospholipase L1-like esterase